MDCPKCARELFEIEQDRVALDCCSGCKGLWFDRGELEKLTRIDSIISKLREVRSTSLSCPRCHESLFSYQTSDEIGVDVEHCRGCGGIWLDRSELDAFRRQAPRGRANPSPRPISKPPARSLKQFLLDFIEVSLEDPFSS